MAGNMAPHPPIATNNMDSFTNLIPECLKDRLKDIQIVLQSSLDELDFKAAYVHNGSRIFAKVEQDPTTAFRKVAAKDNPTYKYLVSYSISSLTPDFILRTIRNTSLYQ